MPIRFRCVFCNQLMGISRRKAGTVVRCPVCASSVTVPSQADSNGVEQTHSPKKEIAQPAPSPLLFERSDFEDALNPPKVRIKPERPPSQRSDFEFHVSAAGNSVPPSVPAQPADAMNVASRPNEILLTRKMATLLSVAAVVALAASFVLGLWVATLVQHRPG